MRKWLELYFLSTLSTSPYSCYRTTLLNTKVLNFYITLKSQLINGCTEIHFIEPGAKVNGAYYRDNLLAKKPLPDIFRKSQGWVLSFNRTTQWRIEHATASLSWSERCPTSFLQHRGRRIHRI